MIVISRILIVVASLSAVSIVVPLQPLPSPARPSEGDHFSWETSKQAATKTSAPLPQRAVVHFPISCTTEAGELFDHAVVRLHSFSNEQAATEFQTVSERDPECAMAYWGVAMSLWNQLGNYPDKETVQKAAQAISKAQELKPRTEREADYIAAIALFYQNAETVDGQTRALAYSNAMAKIHEKYREDNEGAAFYALSLLASEPDNDTAFASRMKAATVLEKLFAEEPNHPGAAHYLIHTYDKPQLAPKGLPAARRYAQISPESPHALHMPSHIFSRLGLWQEDINSNLASIAATRTGLAMHMGAAAQPAHQFHAMDFLIYAELQSGREQDAAARISEIGHMPDDDAYSWGGTNWKIYSQSEYPAIYFLELRQWPEAASLKVTSGASVDADSITYWARTIGAARSGQTEQANRDLEKLALLQKQALTDKEQPWLAGIIGDRYTEAKAWVNFAAGKMDQAVESMRKTADKEEALGTEPPTGIPAREMLAEILMEDGRPQDALKEFETDLQFNPNRFNGLFGAARVNEALGNSAVANSLYKQLLRNCEGTGSSRPELQIARNASARLAGHALLTR
jgi:tetratricopeptide (TPR) repeat protein